MNNSKLKRRNPCVIINLSNDHSKENAIIQQITTEKTKRGRPKKADDNDEKITIIIGNKEYEAVVPSTVSESIIYKNIDEELCWKAVGFAYVKQSVSISALQQNMGIGYNKAAKLISFMEKNGVVTKIQNSNNWFRFRVNIGIKKE